MCNPITAHHKGIIKQHEEISSGIYKMTIEAHEVAKKATPGQFINLYLDSEISLLPRPISLCEIHEESVTIVYAVVGKGTKAISNLKEGSEVKVLGPLGHGFPVEDGDSILVGGGVGTPPLLELAKQLQGKKTIILGYSTEPYLIEEFMQYGQVYIATMDGTVGIKGHVVNVLEQENISKGTVYACGPKPMLQAVQSYALAHDLDGYLSLEERMGCGFGACVGCVTKIKDEKGITNQKVCKDGPVFPLRKVLF